MSHPNHPFLGDTPGRVVVKLLIFSLLVGVVMRLIGWTPVDVFWKIVRFFESLWNMGFAAFSSIFYAVLVGAAIVVPVYIIMRLLNFRR